MAVDRYSVEYHLTPRCWISGWETFFSTTEKEVPPPKDRLETWIKEVEQTSGYSPEDVNWNLRWSDPTKTKEEIAKLRSSFPPPLQFPK
jgi:hypothetical protein